MKITNGATIFIILTLLLIPSVLSDGGLIIHDQDLWGMADEEQQLAAINYKDGFQNMILTVETSEELRGDKVVWIFPVPAAPEKTLINIVKNFPTPFGYDIEERVDDTVSATFGLLRATQIYPLPTLLFSRAMFGATKGIGETAGVTVHETIEKYGLTTELVSTINSQSFENYLTSKDLDVPPNFKAILNDYIGQQYSFVISWISDVESYRKEQPISYLFNLLNQNKLSEAKEFWATLPGDLKQKSSYEYVNEIIKDESLSVENIKQQISFLTVRELGGKGNKLGVFIGFPTEKLYYPLKPTSVYGSKRVPAVIYVMDYVEPELYPDIESETSTNYFLQSYYSVPEELRDFFFGQEKIQDLKYTKIKVSPPSKFLTQDLWMTLSIPAKIKTIDFIERNNFLWGLIIFIISSCLASLISGLIIFRKESPSPFKFMLLGLSNFLTFVGFAIVSQALKIGTRFTQTKITVQQISFKTIIKRISIIGLIAPALVIIGTILAGTVNPWEENILVGLIIIVPAYVLLGLLVAPFVWGYYNDRKTMKFTILFSPLFIILTIIFQLIITAMV